MLLAMLAVGAASCQKEEFTATGGDAPQGTPLTISVTDGGYASGDPRTRATENGYATEFTAGDKIGLYVVKPDNSYAYENVVLTLADIGGGNLAWQAPQGTNLYYEGATANLKYFAYYPYRASVIGDLAPNATDVADFFADVVTKWTPATDQSTHALYTAQDLITGSGTLGSKQSDGTISLSFTMTHAMALVVIETPTTKYTFNNNNPTIPDYYIPAPDTKFYGFTPCFIDGKYRYLVKPTQSGADNLMGSYTGVGDKTKEYAIVQNSIAAANYACYKVDGGAATVITKSHTLQMGDYFMKDGSLVSKDVTSLSDEQKAACIGIVLKVGRDDSDLWKDNCQYKQKDGTTPMSTIHGYVLGLYDAGWSTWGLYGTQVTHTDMNREGETGFYGYKNTNALKSFAEERQLFFANAFPAAYHASEGYEAHYPAPDNSSGWFLPSAGQCWYWYQKNAELLASFKQATGNSGYNWKNYYWSSSEGGEILRYYAWYLFFQTSRMHAHNKNEGYSVRSVLAF